MSEKELLDMKEDALVASGQVEMRKINGYKDMPETLPSIDKAA